jgi:hypothetical protein
MCWRSHVHKVLKSNIIDILKRWSVWVTWGRGRSSVLNENLVDAGRPEESRPEWALGDDIQFETEASFKEKFVTPG